MIWRLIDKLIGHKYTRYPHREDSSLAEGWGYLHCSRCHKDGYMNLSEHTYRTIENDTVIIVREGEV